MNKMKNLTTGLALAIMITVSILVLIPLTGILRDRMTGGKTNYIYEIQLRRSELMISSASSSNLYGTVYQYLEDGAFKELKEWAQSYQIEYYIKTVNGRPVAATPNWTSNPGDYSSLHHFEIEVNGTLYIVEAYQTPLGVENTNTFFPKIWTYLYTHMFLTVALYLLLLCILILSIWQFIIHAGPMLKLCLFMLYVITVDLVFTIYVGSNNLKHMLLFSILEKLVLTIIAGCYLYHLKKLHQKVKNISTPEVKAPKAITSFPVSLRPFAKDVEAASESITVAVNERIKSDRLKTELISNVSHDIKTPLTSVINFSDLILMEKTDNAAITEYADHLHSQSIRLKNLLDSLIEASKASCGAVEMHPIPCKVQTVLEQCIVEYEDKLLANQIELTVLPYEGYLMILADTNALSRIFDNLLVNIAKYALPGSRAYLEVLKENDKICISFKNVSREPCNMSAEELTERFVRGDASRHSEGHGLGLSIVKSLMDLMEGDLEISSKYDLFEIKLIFPEIKESDDRS